MMIHDDLVASKLCFFPWSQLFDLQLNLENNLEPVQIGEKIDHVGMSPHMYIWDYGI
jgi:hypothetical protein